MAQYSAFDTLSYICYISGMKLTRTTLRLYTHLKQEAEQYALEQGSTLQDVFNSAVEAYLRATAKKKTKRMVFQTHDLEVPLDNLRRSDYYRAPAHDTR